MARIISRNQLRINRYQDRLRILHQIRRIIRHNHRTSNQLFGCNVNTRHLYRYFHSSASDNTTQQAQETCNFTTYCLEAAFTFDN